VKCACGTATCEAAQFCVTNTCSNTASGGTDGTDGSDGSDGSDGDDDAIRLSFFIGLFALLMAFAY